MTIKWQMNFLPIINGCFPLTPCLNYEINIQLQVIKNNNMHAEVQQKLHPIRPLCFSEEPESYRKSYLLICIAIVFYVPLFLFYILYYHYCYILSTLYWILIGVCTWTSIWLFSKTKFVFKLKLVRQIESIKANHYPCLDL